MWGYDWTKLKINHIRFYLIILIYFSSRYIIEYDIHPLVNASHAKHLYALGLNSEQISRDDILPQLRTDRGSPNTSHVTNEFFSLMGAELSYASRYGKTGEIYIAGSYPDEYFTRHDIGEYVDFYNTQRPPSEPLELYPSLHPMR
jgi:hypothetical protein